MGREWDDFSPFLKKNEEVFHLVDKKCHSELLCWGFRITTSEINRLDGIEIVGIENAVKYCKAHERGRKQCQMTKKALS